MKSLFKHIAVGLFFLQLPLLAKSQSFNASYDYDANGNRKKVIVTYLITSLKSDTISLDQIVTDNGITEKYKDSIPPKGWAIGPDDEQGSNTLSLYPNPTCGIVLLKVTNAKNDIQQKEGNYYTLWDINGRLLKSKRPLGTLNSIDLSTQPKGIYLIRVSINGQNHVYRIVKE